MEKERLETLNEILEELTYNLDISETDDYVIRQSYKAVGEWLSAKESPLSDFEVEIRPQGSFNLGTIIRPINKDDDIDIEQSDNEEEDDVLNMAVENAYLDEKEEAIIALRELALNTG